MAGKLKHKVRGLSAVLMKSMQQFEPPHEKTPLTDEIKQKYIDEAMAKQHVHIW